MSQKYKLDLIVDNTNEEVSVSGELADEEVKLLEDYSSYAEEVWQTDFVTTGEKGEFQIDWHRDHGSSITTVLPDWNLVMVFLHKFRPLLLQNERTNFYKVHNLLAKKLNHPYFRSAIGLQHELFNGKVCQSEFRLKSNQVLVNSESVLFDWLNSHEYHRDEDKRAFIDSLHQMVPLDVSKVVFLRLLLHKATAAINLTAMIAVLLGKKEEIEVIMRPPAAKGL